MVGERIQLVVEKVAEVVMAAVVEAKVVVVEEKVAVAALVARIQSVHSWVAARKTPHTP